jgi:hypothetical protein
MTKAVTAERKERERGVDFVKEGKRRDWNVRDDEAEVVRETRGEKSERKGRGSRGTATMRSRGCPCQMLDSI